MQIAYEELVQYLGFRDDVIRAAVAVVDNWKTEGSLSPKSADDFMVGVRLVDAVHALRSWDADRGLRGPGATGEQKVRESPAQRAGDHEGAERQG